MVIGAVGLVAAEPIIRAMDQLTGAIKEAYKFTGAAEKATAALGLSFTQGLKKMGPSIAGLRGTIEQQFTTGLMMLDAGLKGNTAGVAKLVNQQMLTGTAYKGTIAQFARLQIMGGIQVEALNDLANQTRIVGATYGISTAKLVKAVETLKEKMVFLNVAGMGKSMSAAVVKLQGVLGAAFDTETMGRMMNLIVNTGTKGLTTLTALGIGDIRHRFEAAREDETATFALLKEAIISAGTTLKGFVGESSLQFGAFTDQLDPAAKFLIPAMERLTEGIEVNADAQINFADLMGTLWSEVWNPIKIWVMGMQPQLNLLAKVITGFMQSLVGGLARFFAKLTPGTITLGTFLGKIIDLTAWMAGPFLSGWYTLQNVIVNLMVPTIFGMVDALLEFGLKLASYPGQFMDLLKWKLKESMFAGKYMTEGWTEKLIGPKPGSEAAKAQEFADAARSQSEKDKDGVIKAKLKEWGIDFTTYEKTRADIDKRVVKTQEDLFSGLRASLNSQTDAWRDEWNTLQSLIALIEGSVASIDEKTPTPPPQGSRSGYLALTDEFFRMSMESVLGIGGNNTDPIRDVNTNLETLIDLTIEVAENGRFPLPGQGSTIIGRGF